MEIRDLNPGDTVRILGQLKYGIPSYRPGYVVAISWSNGNDLKELSNFECALKEILAAAGDDAKQHVIVKLPEQWEWDSVATIAVKVNSDDSDEFTPAAIRAAALANAIDGCCIIDYEHFDRLQSEEFCKDFEDSLEIARLSHAGDGPWLQAFIAGECLGYRNVLKPLTESEGYHLFLPTVVDGLYKKLRNDYLTSKTPDSAAVQ